MERVGRGFTEEFRRSIVLKVESGEQSVTELKRQYGILGHSTILKWCRRYGGKQYPVMPRKKVDVSLSHQEKQLQELRNQVKVLERDLKESRLKQATLETLIDIAEKEYSVNIKKNYGGKRSKK